MKISLSISVALLIIAFSASTEDHGFRHSDEPGYQLIIGNNDEEQTQDHFDFLNCTISEYMKLDYVEACAIFKDGKRQYVDCRHKHEIYKEIPDDELSSDRDRISDICAKEAFGSGQSAFSKFFTSLWISIFGES